jgi:NADH-quinone oxidoreductase subunit C
MNAQEIHAKLKAQFGEAVGDLSEAKIDPFVVVKSDRIVEVCRFAKDDARLAFDYCEDVTGIDWPARNCIEVVYHLFSLQHRHSIVLKVAVDRAQPSLPTVEGVWKAANWLEREVYDMLGVNFAGHPDMRRILLPDDWVGHPLRKDYQEAGGYHGVSNTRPDPLVRMTKRVEEVRKEVQAAAPPPVAAPAAPAVVAPAVVAPAPTTAPPAPAPAPVAPVAVAPAAPEKKE